MTALIYRPAKTAMQSGRGNTKCWVLEFEPEEKKHHDSLMGWVGSGDMKQQLRLRFETKEHAIAYAEKKDIAYRIEEPENRHVAAKNYADNFRWDRIS
jgi:hypothetical protein